MKQQSKLRSSTTAIFTGSIVALLLAGGGAAWLTYHSLSNTTRSIPPIPVQEAPIATETASETPQVYWLDPNSDRLSLQAEPLTTVKSTDKQIALAQAVKQLFAAAAHQPQKTTIPAQAKLLGLTLKNDGIHLNLSSGFTEGGGSDSMVGRLGQVLYTVTSLDPDANVWITVNGQPLDLLGGEGIEVPQPITRRYFQENFQG